MPPNSPQRYQINYASRRTLRELERLPSKHLERIRAAIESLADEPRPPGSIQLEGARHGTRRIRVGSYRVIYRVDDRNYVVTVGYIERRGDTTYRGNYARFG